MVKIKLSEIIEYFEIASGIESVYFNKKTDQRIYYSESTGEIFLTDPNTSKEKELDEDEFDYITEEDNNWVKFPEQYEVNNWKIMEEFCYQIEDENLKTEALNAIHGNGAFRRFKNLISKREQLDEWNKYQEKEYKRIAIEWCEKNSIKYIDDENGNAESEF